MEAVYFRLYSGKISINLLFVLQSPGLVVNCSLVKIPILFMKQKNPTQEHPATKITQNLSAWMLKQSNSGKDLFYVKIALT